jgi:hypothetical protein
MTEATRRDQLTLFIELVCHLAWPSCMGRYSEHLRTFKAPTFAHQRQAIIAKMMHRFGEQYPQDMIRRVAEVEFEIVLEVIKLRDLLYKNSN